MADIEISKEVFSENKIEISDQLLATDISRKLDQHYPGHLWAVNVDSIGGVVTIKNFAVSFTHGYLVKIKEVQDDPTRKACIMGAGEILERAHMRVGKARPGEKARKIDDIAAKYQPRADGRIIV